jgi:hypothetical protein
MNVLTVHAHRNPHSLCRALLERFDAGPADVAKQPPRDSARVFLCLPWRRSEGGHGRLSRRRPTLQAILVAYATTEIAAVPSVEGAR